MRTDKVLDAMNASSASFVRTAMGTDGGVKPVTRPVSRWRYAWELMVDLILGTLYILGYLFVMVSALSATLILVYMVVFAANLGWTHWTP